MNKPEIDLRKMRQMSDEEATEYLREWAIYGLRQQAGYLPPTVKPEVLDVEDHLERSVYNLPDPDTFMENIPMRPMTTVEKNVWYALKYARDGVWEQVLVHMRTAIRRGSKFFEHLV